MKNNSIVNIYIMATPSFVTSNIPANTDGSSLTKAQKNLLEEFKKLEDAKTNPGIKNFIDKAKRFWKS